MNKKKVEQIFITQTAVELSNGKRYAANHKFLKSDLEKTDFDALREMAAIASETEIEKAEELAREADLGVMKDVIEELAAETILSDDPEDVTEVEV